MVRWCARTGKAKHEWGINWRQRSNGRSKSGNPLLVPTYLCIHASAHRQTTVGGQKYRPKPRICNAFVSRRIFLPHPPILPPFWTSTQLNAYPEIGIFSSQEGQSCSGMAIGPIKSGVVGKRGRSSEQRFRHREALSGPNFRSIKTTLWPATYPFRTRYSSCFTFD